MDNTIMKGDVMNVGVENGITVTIKATGFEIDPDTGITVHSQIVGVTYPETVPVAIQAEGVEPLVTAIKNDPAKEAVA